MKVVVLGLLFVSVLVALASDDSKQPLDERSRALEARNTVARERAKVIAEKSIFRKERSSRRREREGTPREIPSPPPPEEDWVLTGVVGRDSGATAIIEEARGSRILRKLVGEAIAEGKLKAIGFDYVEYECAVGVTRVTVGCDFTGKKPGRSGESGRRGSLAGGSTSTSSAAVAPTSVDASPATPAAAAPDSGATESIAEKMRRRRLEEEGKK